MRKLRCLICIHLYIKAGCRSIYDFHQTSGHILPHHWLFGDTLPMHFTPSLRSFHLKQICLTCLVKCPTNRGHNPSCHWRRQILPEGTAVFLLAPEAAPRGCRQAGGRYSLSQGSPQHLAVFSCQEKQQSTKGDVCDSEAADFVLFERSWPNRRWEIATAC